MGTNNRLFTAVFKKSVLISLIPTCAFIAAVCFSACVYQVFKDNKQTEYEFREYAAAVKKWIEDGIQRSEYVLGNVYICGGIDRAFESYHENLEYLQNIRQIMRSMQKGGSDSVQIVIYTANGSVFENEFIKRAERLPGYYGLSEKFLSEGTTLLWADSLEAGGSFHFFRKMRDLNGSVLECKIEIPKYPYPGRAEIFSSGEIPGNAEILRLNDRFSVALFRDNTPVRMNIVKICLAFLALMAAAATLIFRTARKVFAGITYELADFADNLDKEAFDALDKAAPENGELYELKVIREAVAALLSKIKAVTEERMRISVVKKNLELSLLQKQIDPHTLYNSLAAIKLNAHRRGDEVTLLLIKYMIRYYRAVLAKGMDFAALGEELEMIEDYVAINGLSQGKEYSLSINADDDIKNIRIPHLLLQPFVENAVFHGLGGRSDECEIAISAFVSGETLTVTVEDNGYGIPEEKLAKLKDLESYGDSYGIKNAYLRLRLAYNADSAITFDSEKGKGARVTVKLSAKYQI
jgi:signal transduction histidine kinase